MSINNKKVSINTQIANTGKITAIVHKNPESNIQILSTIKSSGGCSVDLNNYYTKEEVYNKEETYNKEEVNSLIDGTEKNIEDLEKDFQDSMDTLESSVSERYTGLEEKMYEINTQLHDTVFDTNGYYFTEKIRPLSIDTSLLTVGSLSQQFTLLDSSFFITKNSTTDNIIWTSGKLVHFAISREDKENTWIFTSGEFNFTSDEPYYVYVKASKNNEEASILVSTVQYITEIDGEDFYYFLCGTVSSIMTPEDEDPFRHLSLSYGTTSINGRFIHTGCIKSNNGETYFDLDKGEIGGNIVFKSGENGEYQNLVDTLLGIDSSIGDIQKDIQDVNAAVGEVDGKSDGLATYIDNAFKDGILDEAERKAIIEQKNGLVSQYNSLIKEHNAIDDYSEYNKLLWSNFIQSWSQLCAEYNKLIRTIDAIINYNSSTQELKTLIDNYNKAYISFDLALNGDKDDESEELRHGYTDYLRSIKKLIDELVADEYADKKVSDIKVGGRNLLYKKDIGVSYSSSTVTRKEVKVDEWKATDAIEYTTSGGNNALKVLFSYDRIPYQGNTTPYCFSGYIKNNGDTNISILIKLSPNKGETVITNAYKLTLNPQESKKILLQGHYLVNQILQVHINAINITDNLSFVVWHWKLEEGNIATDWTPAPEDIDSEFSEINELQSKFQNSLDAINNDEYFSISEKKIIRTDWEAISGEANTSNSLEYYQNKKGSYGEAFNLCKDIKADTVNNAKTALGTAFNTLKNTFYINDIDNLYKDEDYNWGTSGRTTMATNFAGYYNAETDLIKAIQDYYTEKKVGEIEIGGVNLASYNNISYYNNVQKTGNYGFKQITADTKTNFEVKIDNYNGVSNYDRWGYNTIISKLGIYSYTIKTSYETSIIRIGANGSARDTLVSFKLAETIPVGTQVTVSIEITNVTQGSFAFKNVQVELGNKATAWKPNDADIIEARENILKDAMLFTLNDAALQIDLTKSTKLNTEYVFSLESSVLPKNTNLVKVRLYDDPQEADEWNDNYLFEFNITSGTKFAQTLIFNGSFSKLYFNASVANVTLVGVKLAEGNIYTGWEGTPDEQQALITLNNAMKGSTDIIGGLVMTNLIGMKGYGTEASQIKAGISGLNENNNLRFWAGSTAWSNANTAPFRVYDDGRVFGKLFYASQQSLTLNSSHITTNANSEYFSYDNGVYRLNADNIPDTIYLDSTLANYSIGLPKKYSKDKTIEIYNPHKLALSFLDIVPNPTYCNMNNFRNNSWHPQTNASSIMPILSTLSMQGNVTGYMSYNIGVKDTSADNYKPTYIKLKNIKVTLYGQVQYITVNNTAAYYYVMYIPGWVYDNLLIKDIPNNVSQTNVNLGTSTSNTHVRYTRYIGANLPTSNKSFSLDFRVWIVETMSDDYLTDIVNY